jgi:hypothetical protein
MKDGWWQRTPRRPGLVLAVAMLAALAVSAGLTAILTAGGGAHRPLAAGAGLGAGGPVPSASDAPPGPGPAGPGPAPSRSPAVAARLTPSASVPAGASSPASPPGPGHQSPAPPRTAPVSPSPSPSSSPDQGYLLLAPGHLMLTSKPGQPASGFFVLTAANGPVAQYAVRIAAKAGRVSVAPAAGSLALNGFVEVTVTVTSKTALTTQILVEPGNLAVTVVYKPKPAPAPSPSPPGKGPGDG